MDVSLETNTLDEVFGSQISSVMGRLIDHPAVPGAFRHVEARDVAN